MTHAWRRRLFYSLCALFLLAGSIAVGYALGWRLDIRHFSITKVGAIYIRSFPYDADLALDGQPVKKNPGFFDRGTFISNLLPQNYQLAVTREHYEPWQRTITVRPAEVSEIKYAVLVPNEATSSVKEPVRDFWAVGDEIIWKNQKGGLVWREAKLSGTRVTDFVEGPLRALTLDERTGAYFLNDLEASTSQNLSAAARTAGLTLSSPGTAAMLDPLSRSRVISATPRAITLFDMETGVALPLSSSTSSVFGKVAVSTDWIAWTMAEKAGGIRLVLYDRSAETMRDIPPTLPGKTMKIAWGGRGLLGILQDNGEFFIATPQAQTISHIASDVKDFSISGDGQMAAALERRAIEVFSLAGKDYWRFNLGERSSAQRITWYRDARHLFIEGTDGVDFLDIEDDLQENTKRIADAHRSWYNAKENHLYFIRGDLLKKLDFPL